jgi:hypothetical protein
MPPLARQIVPALVSVFDGQLTLLPSQTSCGSQMPVVARHTVPADVRVSLGHADPVPLQYSAGSQTPALARHTELGTLHAMTSEPLPLLKPAVCVTDDVPEPA